MMPPPGCSRKRRDRRPAERRRRDEADRERALPRRLPRREVAVGAGRLVDAGVVDEHVDVPAPGDRLVPERVRRRRVGQVGRRARGPRRRARRRAPSSRPSRRRSCSDDARCPRATSVRAVAAPMPPAAPVIEGDALAGSLTRSPVVVGRDGHAVQGVDARARACRARTVRIVMLSSVYQPRDSGWSKPDDATTTRSSSTRKRSANRSCGSPAYGSAGRVVRVDDVQRVRRQVHRVQHRRRVASAAPRRARRARPRRTAGRPRAGRRGRGTGARCRSSRRPSPRGRGGSSSGRRCCGWIAPFCANAAPVAHERVAVLELDREPGRRAAQVDDVRAAGDAAQSWRVNAGSSRALPTARRRSGRRRRRPRRGVGHHAMPQPSGWRGDRSAKEARSASPIASATVIGRRETCASRRHISRTRSTRASPSRCARAGVGRRRPPRRSAPSSKRFIITM